jgi:hypothetical protein
MLCAKIQECIKGLLKEVGIRDEFLDQQDKLLVQEKESNQELKKLLKLEKEKMTSLTKNLGKARRLSLVSRAQLVIFKIHMMPCMGLIKILKCNLMLFGKASPNLQTTMKLPQVKRVWKLVMKQFLKRMIN